MAHSCVDVVINITVTGVDSLDDAKEVIQEELDRLKSVGHQVKVVKVSGLVYNETTITGRSSS